MLVLLSTQNKCLNAGLDNHNFTLKMFVYETYLFQVLTSVLKLKYKCWQHTKN